MIATGTWRRGAGQSLNCPRKPASASGGVGGGAEQAKLCGLAPLSIRFNKSEEADLVAKRLLRLSFTSKAPGAARRSYVTVNVPTGSTINR